MKNFFLICFYTCLLYFWYQAFIVFLNFSLDSNIFIVDDPRLWGIFLLAVYFLEHPLKK